MSKLEFEATVRNVTLHNAGLDSHYRTVLLEVPGDSMSFNAIGQRYRVTLEPLPAPEPHYRGKALLNMTREELEAAIDTMHVWTALSYEHHEHQAYLEGSDALSALEAELAKRPEPLKPCPFCGGGTAETLNDTDLLLESGQFTEPGQGWNRRTP